MSHQRQLFWVAGLILLVSGALLSADDSAPGTLVKVKTTDFRVVVGEFKAEDSISITVTDLGTGTDSVIDKTKVKSVEREVSDDAAVISTNLPTVVAWKVGKLHHESAKPSVGKIARISDDVIYTNLGEKNSIAVGDHLAIFRNGAEIKDPDTGKVIGADRAKVAELELIDVQAGYSKAKLLGNTEIKLQVGDAVETLVYPVQIAVVAPGDATGTIPPAALSLAEEVIDKLVSKKVAVVEKDRLLASMKQLSMQNADLFEPAAAQKFGRQVGATAVLAGKIVPGVGTTSGAQLRLIEVSTGKILLAVATPIRTTANPAGGVVVDGPPTTEGKAPREDHILAEDELATTTGGGMNPHIYRLVLPPKQEKVKLLASTISIKMEPNSGGDPDLGIAMSVDYGKNWIGIAHFDPAAIHRGRRNNDWYHIPLAGSGASRSEKRKMGEMNIDVDEIQVRVDGGHAAGVKVETVVWSSSQFTRTPLATPAPKTTATPPTAAADPATGKGIGPASAAPGELPAPLFVKAGKEATANTIGHDISDAFVETAPAGMILVGFEFTGGKADGKQIVKSARAIYRGANGEVVGKQLGRPDGEVTRVIARPGYGVAAVEGTGGARHIFRLTLHYVRVNGDSFVAGEAYDAKAFGTSGSGSVTFTANKPVTGIHGAAGANIDAIGLTNAE